MRVHTPFRPHKHNSDPCADDAEWRVVDKDGRRGAGYSRTTIRATMMTTPTLGLGVESKTAKMKNVASKKNVENVTWPYLRATALSLCVTR